MMLPRRRRVERTDTPAAARSRLLLPVVCMQIPVLRLSYLIYWH